MRMANRNDYLVLTKCHLSFVQNRNSPFGYSGSSYRNWSQILLISGPYLTFHLLYVIRNQVYFRFYFLSVALNSIYSSCILFRFVSFTRAFFFLICDLLENLSQNGCCLHRNIRCIQRQL